CGRGKMNPLCRPTRQSIVGTGRRQAAEAQQCRRMLGDHDSPNFSGSEDYTMAAWRMAFRVGKNGHELWPDCQQLGVAAIEYPPVDGINLSECSEEEVRSAWSKVERNGKTSLKRFVREMKQDDVTYVKQGKKIVGKGVVTGAYHFDKKNRIQAPDGTPWQHQRTVSW